MNTGTLRIWNDDYELSTDSREYLIGCSWTSTLKNKKEGTKITVKGFTVFSLPRIKAKEAFLKAGVPLDVLKEFLCFH